MAKSNKNRPVQHSGDPAAAAQKSEARKQAAELARQTKKKQQARKAMIQGAIGVVVVAVVIGAVVFVLSNRDNTSPELTGGPAEVTTSGGFVVGSPEAAVTVQVVEDFQCPACKQFEEAVAEQLKEYAAGDEVNVEYRTIAFLDRASTTKYSSRALNASACVMDSGDEVWSSFHELMFERQPDEGGPGLSDDEIVGIAGEAGADEAEVSSCMEDETYADWVKDTTDKAFDDGVSGTPTVYVDGEVVEPSTPAAIQAAVDEALAS